MYSFEWILAWRYLGAKQKEGFISLMGWLSFSGIALGVATLIIVMSVMNGFRYDLMEKILGLHGHIAITGPYGQVEEVLQKKLLKKIKTAPQVIRVHSVVEGQAMIIASFGSQGVMVRGMEFDDIKNRFHEAHYRIDLSYSSFDNTLSHPPIFVGKKLAQRLHLKKGDTLTLLSPTGHATAFGMIPRIQKFSIQGIFQAGLHDYDQRLIFCDVKTAQDFFQLQNNISSLEVFVEDFARLQEPLCAIEQMLFPWSGSIVDWQRTNEAFFRTLQIERNVMFLILTLMIAVATLNIVSSMVMLVKEKNPNIAILRTMGATKRSIARIFFIIGVWIGMAGTFAGLGLGLGTACLMQYLREILEKKEPFLWGVFQGEVDFLLRLPVRIESTQIICIVAIALALSFIATLYPALRASRTSPLKILRQE